MPCRVNRRRQWTSRILLEAQCHEFNSFVTLTFADVPKGHHGPPQRRCWELVPEELTNFLKRLRYFYPAPFRHFSVGEYGEKYGRPHFHCALFGVSMFDGAYLEKAWTAGAVHVGELNKDTAQYISGYVCKKWTKGNEDFASEGLRGRRVEFARMSRNPGIGGLAVPILARSLAPDGDLTVVSARGDVPEVIRTGGKQLPLGRFMRQKLRQSFGWEATQPQPIKRELARVYRERSDQEVKDTEARRVAHYKRAVFRQNLARSKKSL